jgi:hypothetical protein
MDPKYLLLINQDSIQQGGKVLGEKEKPEISALSHGETANTTLCYVCASRLIVLDAK